MSHKKLDENCLKMISTLRRAIAHLEAGYSPEYMAVIYPLPNEPSAEIAILFTSNDITVAKNFDGCIGQLQAEFRKQFLLEAIGVSSEDLDRARAQFEADIKKAADRALDQLTNDPPVKDTKLAEELLRKLRKKNERQ